MRQYDLHNLVVHPGNSTDPGVIVEVTPELAGWDYISFQLRHLPATGQAILRTSTMSIKPVRTALFWKLILKRSISTNWIAQKDSPFNASTRLPNRHCSVLVSPSMLCC